MGRVAVKVFPAQLLQRGKRWMDGWMDGWLEGMTV